MESHPPDPPPRPEKPARPEEPAAPPTPVREAMDAPESGADAFVEDVEERSLRVDGVEWTVRVLGRCRGGPGSAPTDLLLLGFARGGEAAAELECLLPGRSLSGTSERRLISALGRAAPPLDPDRQRNLFPGTSERRGRRS